MKLALLKNEHSYVAWIDDKHVEVGGTIPNLFGKISGALEDALRSKEQIVPEFPTHYNHHDYSPLSEAEMAELEAQLGLFHIKLPKKPEKVTEAA